MIYIQIYTLIYILSFITTWISFNHLYKNYQNEEFTFESIFAVICPLLNTVISCCVIYDFLKEKEKTIVKKFFNHKD